MKLSNRIFATLLCTALLMASVAPALSVLAASIPACDCSSTSQDLSSHADSCARKSYIRSTYIPGNSAEQIYSDWESFDSAVQDSILTFLSWDDYTKYTALTELINNQLPNKDPYPTTGSENITVDLVASKDAFPDGTTFAITPIDAKSYCSVLETSISELDSSSEILALYALDLSFICNGNEIQPAESVEITFSIPKELVPSAAQIALVYHINDDGSAEGLGKFGLLQGGTAQTLTVKSEHFSSYVVAFTGQKYQATLLRNALDADSDYSVVTLPATLFDYDTTAFNNAVANLAGTQKYFKFLDNDSDADFPANAGGRFATQGILKSTLKNGLPSMAYGYDNGALVFGTDSFTGKTVYENVQFELIYDKNTKFYEYNSALNHAQYNAANNKIELYTDTMGPYNFYTAIPLTQATASNHCTRTTGTTYKFKITGTDPQILINHTDRAVTSYQYVYFRMNSSAAQSAGLTLYLDFDSNNFIESQTIKLDLKSGWYEYYFDISQYAGKTLQRIRLDPGTTAGVTVELSTMGFIQTTTGYWVTSMSDAGFYPFSNIATSYPNIYESFDLSDWKTNLQLGKGLDKDGVRATRSFYNEIYNGSVHCPTDMFHFGLSMELDVYLPVGYDTAEYVEANGDLIFEFSGDDDLWIFVDGKLVLDVGGAHTRVDGSINFTEKYVTVDSVKKLLSASTAEDTAHEETDTFADLGIELTPGHHKVQIFYLERASTASNLRLRFNLPAIPTGDVEVSKTVVDDSHLVNLNALSFRYTIEIAGQAYANKTYQVITRDENGNLIDMENLITDSGGAFTLRHNQTAYFNDINESTSVKVSEEGDVRFITTVNNSPGSSASGKTSNNNALAFAFVNTVQLTSIVVTKNASPVSADIDDMENQSFLFRIKGNDVLTENVDISIVISLLPENVSEASGSNSATITNIPLGLYTVFEDTNWSWRYEPVTQSITQTAGAEDHSDYQTNNVFSFENQRRKIYWLSGDNIACNCWNDANIVKREDQSE